MRTGGSYHPDQFVLTGPESDLFRVDESGFPFGIGMIQVEVFVVGIRIPELLPVPVQAAPFAYGNLVAPVHAGLVQRVLAAADVQGVAVRKEGLAAALADVIRDDSCIMRTQMRQIAEFAEMDLDGGAAVGKIDLFKTGALHQTVQFLRKRFDRGGVKIGKKYFGRFHGTYLLPPL